MIYLSVDIVKEKNNETLFAKLENSQYDLKYFKTEHLKDYVCKKRNVAGSDRHEVKLWKVNVVDELDSKDKLNDEMKSRQLFSDCFQRELNGDPEFIVTNVHVIAVIRKCLPTFYLAIKNVIHNLLMVVVF
ncbi:hypothetical protein RclHR1_10760006 [Rhizophagus clarus]|uniref:Uncharacterized protein n=1 Tax=Rhizophagus clarus TaxID=94130 RepID=A0A2Z6QH50_9GLOM|nr:hypothetical protein RclHR1_10760006 [Rhizophagus clarus]